MADYNDVTKDKCAREFLRLKDCYLVNHPTPSFYTQITNETQFFLTGGSEKGVIIAMLIN
jgi:hypothetical protein